MKKQKPGMSLDVFWEKCPINFVHADDDCCLVPQSGKSELRTDTEVFDKYCYGDSRYLACQHFQ